ncbi:MAG: hypothetical protein ABWZ30_00980 [Jiangellaceae bacterium]
MSREHLLSELRTRVDAWRIAAEKCEQAAGPDPATTDQVEWDAMGTIYTEAADAIDRLLSPIGLHVPRAIVVTDNQVSCPECGDTDCTIVEVDAAVRRNPGGATVEHGAIVQLSFSRDDSNFEHIRYECGRCGQHLALPDLHAVDFS